MLRQIIAPFLMIGVACAADPAPSLDWMGGHWCAELGEETVEEFWLPPHGGVAIGLGRTRTSDRTTAFEYFRIVEIDGRAVLAGHGDVRMQRIAFAPILDTLREIVVGIFEANPARALVEIEKDIRALDADEKRELLRSLITELDTPADPDVEKAWLEESQRRYRELVEGKVKGIPGRLVFQRLRSRLGQ